MSEDEPIPGMRWSHASTYSRMAQDHLARMKFAETRELELKQDGYITREELNEAGPELLELSDVIGEAAVSAIVFAGMAAEAYIYDYAARNLGQSYTDNHVETLNTESKWVVITQLVTGKPFPKDRHAFQLLKGLIKARNKLVHYKSREVKTSEITPDAIRAAEGELRQNARDGVKTLFLLANEMEILHPGELARIRLV